MPTADINRPRASGAPGLATHTGRQGRASMKAPTLAMSCPGSRPGPAGHVSASPGGAFGGQAPYDPARQRNTGPGARWGWIESAPGGGAPGEREAGRGRGTGRPRMLQPVPRSTSARAVGAMPAGRSSPERTPLAPLRGPTAEPRGGLGLPGRLPSTENPQPRISGACLMGSARSGDPSPFGPYATASPNARAARGRPGGAR